MWKGHEIRGTETYFQPWTEINQHINNITEKLKKRFPATRSLIYCKLWILKNGKIIVKTIQMEVSEVMNNVILMNKGKRIKLKSTFLEKCKAAEKQFAKFVSIDIEFVDFLYEKYYLVKDMSEKQFTEYVINLK